MNSPYYNPNQFAAMNSSFGTSQAPFSPSPIPQQLAKPMIKKNPLSDEDRKLLEGEGAFDIGIDAKTKARATCHHYRQDGSFAAHLTGNAEDEYQCEICGTTWIFRPYTKEEVRDACKMYFDILQCTKVLTLGLFPAQSSVEYAMIGPFALKTEQLYNIGVNNFMRAEQVVNGTDPYNDRNRMMYPGLMNYAMMGGCMNPYFMQNQMPGMAMPQDPNMMAYQQPQGFNPMYGQPIPNPSGYCQQQMPQYPQQNSCYTPNSNGYALNAQGAAQPGMVNTNMPAQPNSNQQPQQDSGKVNVTTDFKK